MIQIISLGILFYAILTLLVYFIYLKFHSKTNFSNKNICLLIAHPDDEAMFFGPILRHLAKSKNRIYVLCMTSGDYYGKGGLRAKEMKLSCCCLLEESLINLTIVNEPEKLPDHPSQDWDEDLAFDTIKNYLKQNSIEYLFTFDKFGVSSHLNHCFLNKLALRLKKHTDLILKHIFELETVNRLRKFIFIFDLIKTILIRSDFKVVSWPNDYKLAFKSMLKHKSQLAWFRWLYLITSRYMLINNFNKL